MRAISKIKAFALPKFRFPRIVTPWTKVQRDLISRINELEDLIVNVESTLGDFDERLDVTERLKTSH